MTSPVEMAKAGDDACLVCGGARFTDAVIGYDRSIADPADYVYRRCRDCSLLRLTPIPSPERIARAYPESYPPHASPPDAPPNGSGRTAPVRASGRDSQRVNRFAIRHVYSVDRPVRSPVARRFVSALGRVVMRGVLEPRGENRLLDIGCGSGAILARYRALGWDVEGVEPSARGVSACRQQGLRVHAGTLDDAKLAHEHFDAILMHHVIEHVPDPLDALIRARGLLAPGGVVVVVTPNSGGVGFRLYGSCWYALDAPRHLHLFTADNLARLARRAGLAVKELVTDPSPRTLWESRQLLRTQGPLLPTGVDARAAILARARETRDAARPGLRPLLGVLSRIPAKAGYGETLRAVLARSSA